MAILSAIAVSDCNSQFCLSHDVFSNPLDEQQSYIQSVVKASEPVRSEPLKRAGSCDQAGSIPACDREDGQNVYRLMKLQAARFFKMHMQWMNL